MRPVSFAFPSDPEDITPSGGDFYVWRYTLICEEWSEIHAVIRVSKRAAYQAERGPDVCGPEVADAVYSRGQTVIWDNILKRDDPWLHWVVHRDGIIEDDYALEG
jgi:hypothetical protein